MAYPSSLSDEQWLLISALIPKPKSGGRPRSTSERQIIDAVMYVLKTGCQWRQLPSEFPHWRTVYGYFADWGKIGVWKKVQRKLYFAVRMASGRKRHPSILSIDSQSVATSKMGGVRGFDGGKRVKGRKRHVAVDSLGFPVAFSVTPANTHDLKGGRKILPQANKFLRKPSFKKVYADGTYNAQSFRVWVKERFDATLRISGNLAQKLKKFVPVSQRWVIERTFAWLKDFRRLSLDYERTTNHSRFMLRLAAIRLMLARLAPSEHEVAW